ncbi:MULTISPECIES: DUF6338 family protein [Curtobacterium]|uniref:DUF6338 family protein n=1 Tax=Curtobacterium TaxID=2034 RepID=UPI0034A0C692
MWNSAIPRNTSAWARLFNDAPEDAAVDVALVLKSGGWVSGTLYEFDNDPDPHAHRAIVLTQPRYRAEGSDTATQSKVLTTSSWMQVRLNNLARSSYRLRSRPTVTIRPNSTRTSNAPSAQVPRLEATSERWRA